MNAKESARGGGSPSPRKNRVSLSSSEVEAISRRGSIPIGGRNNSRVIEVFGDLAEKKYIACIDREMSCWDPLDPSAAPEEEREDIEEGIELLDPYDGYRSLGRWKRFVRPTKHPILTDYCKKLCGITQQDVDNADPLSEVLPSLLRELPDKREFVWAAWGDDSLGLDAKYRALCEEEESVLDPRVINAAVYFRTSYGRRKGGLAGALKQLGLKQEAPAHRALPDAISLGRVVAKLGLTPLHGFVSNARSYWERVEVALEEHAIKISKRHKLDIEIARELLRLVNWELKRAEAVLKLLR